MSHDPNARFRQDRTLCERCGDPIENAVLNERDEYICLECQADMNEAAYDRQQEGEP